MFLMSLAAWAAALGSLDVKVWGTLPPSVPLGMELLAVTLAGIGSAAGGIGEDLAGGVEAGAGEAMVIWLATGTDSSPD